MSKKFNSLKTGVIGVGSMGKNHARIYNDISNLVGVSDLNKDQGNEIASSYNCNFYSNYRELLDNVDAVTIAVPTTFHERVSIDALEKSVHVLVEKPLSHDVESSISIVEQARHNNLKLAVGHIEQHNPIIKKIKKNLFNGTWGEVLSISSQRFSPYPQRINDVGVLTDLTIHDVDIIRSLFESDCQSIFVAGTKPIKPNFEDNVKCILKFDNGKIGLCETNWITPHKVRNIEITTTTHSIRANYIAQTIDVSKMPLSDQYSPDSLSEFSVQVNKEEPLKLELIDFLDSIITDKDPLVTGHSGIQAVKIIQAGLQSLKEGIAIGIN